MNLANKITILRVLLVPVFIAFILYSKWQIALFIFIIASISDILDGYTARVTRQITELGTILDPLADKLLILSAFICLSVVGGGTKPPPYVPIIIISRDAILVLGVLLIYFTKGKLEVKPTYLGKATTLFQMITVVGILAKLAIAPILLNTAVILTILSGTSYVLAGMRALNEK